MSRVIEKDVILKSRVGLVSKNTQRPDIVTKDSIIEVKSGLGTVSKKDKVLECGPLESMFPCSESKILDFLVTFQEYDYSISDIAEHSGVGFKTTLGVVKNLEMQQVILNTRNVGRAKMYKLNLESPEANGINKLALGIAVTRAGNQVL